MVARQLRRRMRSQGDDVNERYVVDLHEVVVTGGALAGGKGAHLGELSRIEGIHVPAGFCITTEAFRRVTSDAPLLTEQLDALATVSPDDRGTIRASSAEIRRTLETIAIPDDVETDITRSLATFGDQTSYAIRSSATAEDGPTASSAGQQDTYLNVVGRTQILEHVSRCWASLFSERAVTYRLHQGVDHRLVHIAVVVQQMVFPVAAGVLFTADPVTSNRKVSYVEATFGLGESLVSGLVTPDRYAVRHGAIIAKAVASKALAIYAAPSGGTQSVAIESERQNRPALTDEQVVRLVQLGRRIEAHFGQPQDIEWCLADEELHIVQSRPITTLFPIPPAGDDGNHVYVSVGHQQMMTDPMKPLGLSLWQLTTPRAMAVAGGRLFVDVAPALSSPDSRAPILEALGRSDPLIGDALRTVLARDDFLPAIADEGAGPGPGAHGRPGDLAPIEADPAIVIAMIDRGQGSIRTLKQDIRTKSGAELLDFILSDLPELKRILFDPKSTQVFMSAIDATQWLNDTLKEWLGQSNAADALTQSVPHNVTSEMGLALLDVADVIRPHPDVVAFLHGVTNEHFLDEMLTIAGGTQARDAIVAYLDRYGMRCVGEIDITRPRWSERPTSLLPLLLSNIENFESGAAARRFKQGRENAKEAERDLLGRVRALPDGDRKAAETKRMIDRVRTFIGFREYPKYFMISRYFVYKQSLLEEAQRLVQADVLAEIEDMSYLTLEELRDVVGGHGVDAGVIGERKRAFVSYQTLTPPRVMTSDGEVVSGSYGRTDAPDGALIGLAVSAGTVEGRARVVLDLNEADLDAGDILITAFTDPSWTPAFVTVAGLVTEVGGLMTHGAVIAREYGLPAVVGVEHATRLIRDGQRIRVHGTQGYVEILDEALS